VDSSWIKVMFVTVRVSPAQGESRCVTLSIMERHTPTLASITKPLRGLLLDAESMAEALSAGEPNDALDAC
jgi:hypothetical protein